MDRMPELDEDLRRECRRLLDPMVLASASPNRLETLLSCGIHVTTRPQDTSEDHAGLVEPDLIVRHISRLKMDSYVSGGQFDESMPALALDTMVSFDGMMLGKPRSREEAGRMLSSFSGRDQEVVTGYVLYVPGHGLSCSSAHSKVRFCHLTPSQVEEYLDTGEWQGAAGGYRIQKSAWRLVESIEGSWSNVVGIPLEAIVDELRAVGWRNRH